MCNIREGKHRFIVFEGLDGTGKTSIARQIQLSAERTKFLSSPPQKYNQLRKYVCSEGDFLTRFLYFLSANAMLSNRVNRLLPGSSIVCDRYVYSTVADFAFYSAGSRISRETLNDLVKLSLKLVQKPDVVVYLTCQYNERVQRIRSRTKSAYLEKDNFDAEYCGMVHRAYTSMSKRNWILFDTTGKELRESVGLLQNILSQQLSFKKDCSG